MEIAYDVAQLPQRKIQRKDSAEIEAVKEFLAGQRKNMVFTYDDSQQAKRRYDALRGYRKNHKLDTVFDCYRVENQIVIEKTKKKGRPGPVK